MGVIDEGMQVGHADLAANIWVNPNDAADGSDNDGNTYVDDINGWDFYNNDNSVYDGTADDHGTHVTGTIAAVGGNGLGVAGVNWSAKLISGKFLGPTGGTTDAAIKAVDYFTALKKRGINIVALNNSWGGGAYSQFLHDAIIRAAKADILFIAAAGNGDRRGRAINLDATPYYPACYDTSQGTATENAASYDSVIAVTAIDNIGNKASWANYGATKVDLGAPGVNIYSTLPDNTYGAYDGTSMATPHVTGAVALYASTHPAAKALEIKTAILAGTTPTASLAGKTATGGRLNLSTVITPTTPPGPGDEPPTVSIASPLNNAIVAGTVEITAEATDDHEVTQVQFFVDGTSIGTDTVGSDGWSVSWNTSEVGDGSHTLTAVAKDSIGQTTTSEGVIVLADNVVDTCAIVIPSGYEDVPANNWGGTLAQPLRIQQVYTPQSMGIAKGVTIYGMAFRLDSSVVSAVNGSIKILVRLSTTAAQPDKLNTRFSANVGADVKTLFNGTLDITGVVPDGFDIVIPFGANSFAYDPGAGNLLVDIATYTGVADANVNAAYVGGDGTSRIFALNPSATKGAYYDTQGDVIRFQLCPPSPSP
ncbi:MAG TPA: S8 family serine peptidase [Verrucomicrobiota bacterium]|nr:S8 family serine peptidase [Verrucomicrobiota bacterium]